MIAEGPQPDQDSLYDFANLIVSSQIVAIVWPTALMRTKTDRNVFGGRHRMGDPDKHAEAYSVLHPAAGRCEEFAAEELHKYLRRMTGKALPIRTSPERRAGEIEIRVRRRSQGQKLPLGPTDDDFEIGVRADPNRPDRHNRASRTLCRLRVSRGAWLPLARAQRSTSTGRLAMRSSHACLSGVSAPGGGSPIRRSCIAGGRSTRPAATRWPTQSR